jgi:RNA polymerase sigma-70 factor (ECF subfamily)
MRDPLATPEPLIRRVYSYVAYRVGPGPDAEDVTSETFERALRYRSVFESRRGEPVAWLIGIARRCISDHFAGRLTLVDDVPESEAPGDVAADSAARIDLRRAVATLTDRDRELVALRYGADLTARQIGELLDMQTNAVEVALHRALRTLRETLDVPEAAPVQARRLDMLEAAE